MIQAQGINHIGIAVRSIGAQRAFYEDVLGAVLEGEETIASQHVRVAFYRIGGVGGVLLELLEATSPESPIAKFIEKRGEGLHHIAYTVSDIDERLRALHAADIQLVDQTARAGAHHTQVAFLHPRSSGGVLTELVEPAADQLGT